MLQMNTSLGTGFKMLSQAFQILSSSKNKHKRCVCVYVCVENKMLKQLIIGFI